MGQELLKKLRIIVPGSIVFFVILTIIAGRLELKKIFSQVAVVDTVYFTLIVFVLGGAYHLFNIRGLFIKDSLAKIHSNIRLGLIDPFKENKEISDKLERLKKDDTLLNIFYDLIDNDPSLKAKQKNVYFNGLFWTTTIDLIPISFLGVMFHFICFKIYKSQYYLNMLWLWLIIYILAYILLPKVTKKHIELSNEQIKFIKTKYAVELMNKIKGAVI